jgi:formylglycine-generating enzyme required for sulfatase activity
MKKLLILITFMMVLSVVIIGNESPEMVLVQAGTFQMGNTRDDYSEGGSDEKPVHTVNLTYDYYIGKYEVTFNEYDAYCEAGEKTKPNDFSWGHGSRPVINISWWGAIAYCNWLSEQEGFQPAYDSIGNLLNKNGQVTKDITEVEGYRLPTEAEWEYAARGGHEVTDYQYAGSNSVDEVSWYWDNSNNKTHEVGQKDPNELGIYDMSGNVWEWCHDRYGSYTNTKKTNPIGPDSGSIHVGRGGCWIDYDRSCRIVNRDYGSPSHGSQGLGLRIARTQK